MLFKIIKDGKVKMFTTYEECIPSEKQLKKDGYKIKIEGDK